jgi:hypothetical protein
LLMLFNALSSTCICIKTIIRANGYFIQNELTYMFLEKVMILVCNRIEYLVQGEWRRSAYQNRKKKCCCSDCQWKARAQARIRWPRPWAERDGTSSSS